MARLSLPTAGAGVPRRPAREELRRFLLGAAFVLVAVVMLQLVGRQAASSSSPVAAGSVVLGLGLAAAVFFGIARDSSVGVLCWLFAALFSEAYPNVPMARLAFVALVAGWFIAIVTHRRPLKRFGVTELLMFAYLLLNIGSAIAPHALPADTGVTPSSLIYRGILFPFMLFVIARQTMTDRRAVKSFLWFLVVIGVYVTATSIFYKLGPHALVFPRQILDQNLGINPERGRGPQLNSAADGLTMVAAMIAAIYLGVQKDTRHRRWVIGAAMVMPLGIYLTQTRSIWLSAALAIILGAMFARGFRRWYVLVLALAVTFIGVNWQKFLSADRQQGGVSSTGEVEARLNDWATALWAIPHHKTFGWGISRFPEINTIHHQHWGNLDWNLGYGFIGHNTHLTTAAELGLVGLSVWLAVLISVTVSTARAWRLLPRDGLLSRGFVFSFWCAWLGWLINSAVLEMRIFTFLNGLFFAWAGIAAGLGDRAREGTLEFDPEPEEEPEIAPVTPEFAYETGFRT
jgi:O-antigen ligase